jgi:hypothetical protein
MVSFLRTKRVPRRSRRPRGRTTAVSFSAEDLADLGHLVAVGQARLSQSLGYTCLLYR